MARSNLSTVHKGNRHNRYQVSCLLVSILRLQFLSSVLAFIGIQYGWWSGRNGKDQYYLTGSNDTLHPCACGIADSCAGPSVTCDCDAVTSRGLFDEGYYS